MSELVERVARAIFEAWAGERNAVGTWDEAVRAHDAGAAPYPTAYEYVELARKEARAAIEAMRDGPLTLEMQMAGAEAIALYNIERDGPATPHDECKTPDEWMMRGANIAGRMVSGEEAARSFKAVLDAALTPETGKTKRPSQ